MPLQLYTVPSDPLVPSIPGKACLSLCFRPVIDWLQPLSEPGLDKWPKKIDGCLIIFLIRILPDKRTYIFNIKINLCI